MAGNRRRPKGEGSYWEQADGTWRGYVPVGLTPAGNPRRKYFTAATEKDAERARRRLLAEVEDGRPPAVGRQTLGQYLDWWLGHKQARVRPGTLRFYRQKLALVDPAARRIPVDRFAPEDMDDLLDRLAARGLSAQTVKHVRDVVRNALNLKVRRRQLAFNAAALAEVPDVPKFDAQPYTAEQARALLAAVAGDRWESLYVVTLATGLRKSEALGVTWPKVDLDQGVLTPWTQPEWLPGGGFRLVELKTEESRAPVVLAPAAVESLRARRRLQAQERLAAGPAWTDYGLVWTTGVGTAIQPQNLHRHFHAACDRAGVPRRRWHDLRHTAPTLLLEVGVPLEVVSALLRHTSIVTTKDVYGHVTPRLLRQVADSMQQILFT